jgi:hypothetical protein
VINKRQCRCGIFKGLRRKTCQGTQDQKSAQVKTDRLGCLERHQIILIQPLYSVRLVSCFLGILSDPKWALKGMQGFFGVLDVQFEVRIKQTKVIDPKGCIRLELHRTIRQ